ncbi:F0F1 ATP synthase subunit epsilon [Trichococcus collinsii]|jgi:F-type H+-transporting ATPase subunit epsilon|uniref:ATP synthase epsilon chain n=1 Tax=Trichococcus collinsii TaxID=157076 RepID=A0AB37ZXX2_9LACT|nr:F0F1 ATP synthase subunit epsilon [Trichococcus collinsii]CZR09801.1 atp synthase ion epsilon subunit hydrolase cf1 synthesis chain hydrogen [Trichococcus collinsii]SEA12562.1 F-type H+-transporting ATPase subunit epsilon [Trichococcus collinsii]HEX5351555.1 F0F1 ATP synthase subunit epsilon [Trichococcus sp.]
MAYLQVNVVTPDGIAFQHRAKAVTAKTTDGGITIMPNHTPIIVPLAIADLIVTRVTDELAQNHIAVNGGIMEVRDNIVNIIANSAEREKDIDIDRAEVAKERAERRMAEARDIKNEKEFQRAKISLSKAINRIGVSKNRSN